MAPKIASNSSSNVMIHITSSPKIHTVQINSQLAIKYNKTVAAAIIGGYFGLFILYKIKSAFSSAPAVDDSPAPVAAASSASGAIPDVDSEDFGTFLESEENIMKLVDSFEK